MEESNIAVGGEVATPEVSQASETTTSVPESTESVDLGNEGAEVSTTPEQSGRAKSRQNELANKLKDKDVELETLRSQIGKEKPGEFLNKEQPQYQPNADRELTIEEYQKHVTSVADGIVTKRMQQYIKENERIAGFEKGVSVIEAKHPELNPDSESYNQELSDTITKLYNKSSKTNPELNVEEFVNSAMSLRTTGIKKGEESASTAMANQDESITPSNDTPDRMSSKDKLSKGLKDGTISAKEAEKIIGISYN